MTHPNADAVKTVAALPTLVLTVEEAASVLRIGRTTVFALVKNGEIRSYLVGRSRRIPLSAINEYLARKEEEAVQYDAAA